MTNQPLKERVLSRITALAKSVAEPLGLSVLEVRLSQQGRRRTLEVCILRKHGEAIGLSDCEQVSRALDQLLEAETQNSEPLLGGPFLLEVVSPGIERQLTTASELELFSGQRVRIRARENVSDLGSEFVCTLLGGDETHLQLANAQALINSDRKVAKSKATGKKANQHSAGRSEQPGYSAGNAFRLELAKVFKVNLYSDDLKKEKKAQVS